MDSNPIDDDEEDFSSLPELSPEDMIPPTGEEGVMPPAAMLLPPDDPVGAEDIDFLEQTPFRDEGAGPFCFSRQARLSEDPLPVHGESRIIGLRLAGACLTYRVTSSLANIQAGDEVLVETRNGEMTARVVFVATPGEAVAKTLLPGPVTKVVRRWTTQDQEERNRRAVLEREARIFCKQTIREMKLPMKLSHVVHEGSKAVFYYTADNRIDFRELVRVLARQLHLRVEMRQVGVRDETRMLRGFGPCGKELCCAQYLDKFKPVSVRMAKNQELSLNPDAISGVCGRLMCCLVYENEAYLEMRKRLPKPGAHLMTSDGLEVQVKVVHPLKGVLDVLMPTGEKIPLALENLRPMPGGEALQGAEPAEVEDDEDGEETPAPAMRRLESPREERGAPAKEGGEGGRGGASAPRRGRMPREGGGGEGGRGRPDARSDARAESGGRGSGGRPPRAGEGSSPQPRQEARSSVPAQGEASPRRGGEGAGAERPASSQTRRERFQGQGQGQGEGARRPAGSGEGGERRGQHPSQRRERAPQNSAGSLPGESAQPRTQAVQRSQPGQAAATQEPTVAGAAAEGVAAQRRRRRRRRGGVRPGARSGSEGEGGGSDG